MQNTPHGAPAGFDWVTRIDSWSFSNSTLHLLCHTAHSQEINVDFEAVTPEIWRISVKPFGIQPLPTPILVDYPRQTINTELIEFEQELCVQGTQLKLQIQRNPWRVSFQDATGSDVLRENPSDIDGLGNPFVLPLGFSVTPDGVVNMVSESFHLRPDEHLFGLGEKFTKLDKSGQRIVTWTQDAFGSTSERSHKNIPFLLSTRGYGLLLDTGARVTWDLGVSSCQSYTVAAETSALDAYVIYGPSPAEILKRYIWLTGKSPVPPKWTFGLWLSSSGAYRDQSALERLVEGLDSHDIPADVIHIDTWWMKWRQYCDFRWDRDAFPSIETFIADLKQKDLHLSLWEHSYVSVESDLFEIGKEQGYFLKHPDGEIYVIDYGLSLAPRPDGVVRTATPDTSWNARVAIIDLTNPQAYKWFQDLHRPLLQMGVSVFKTDFGEDVPRDAVFSNGETGETMHNLYPLLYNRCVYEVTQQERGYGVVWARSGTAGNQRYPVCWSGDPAADFDSLACTIRGGLSIGLSGVPFWSNDIGAFRGLPSPRLYIRWAQFGLFCSHSRMHGDSPREPWFFGDDAVRIVRDYVNLRYSFFPYIYSASHEASFTGMPVIRAMPLMFPKDPTTYSQDLQYMLGPWLLVAPVYDESDGRHLYLPEGEWIDFWTGHKYQGPNHVWVNAPLNALPLFVRAGAIIPRMLPAKRIPQALIDPLVVEIYAGPDMEYQFHEDDGVTVFHTRLRDGKLMLDWYGGPTRAYIFRLIGFVSVSSVEITANGHTDQLLINQLDNAVLEVKTFRVQDGQLQVR